MREGQQRGTPMISRLTIIAIWPCRDKQEIGDHGLLSHRKRWSRPQRANRDNNEQKLAFL